MIPTSNWETVERPGWFGEERDRRLAEYEQRFGKGNWRIRHKLGPRTLNFDEAIKLYELCYELDFNHPDRRYIWSDLIEQAEDVWTEQLSDVRSGTDYSIQLAPASHYEDIAIRRIFEKYRARFKGNRLIRIRADSEDTIGKILSSLHVKFLYPEYIEPPINDKFPWWDRHKGSLECFWQLNQILQVRAETNRKT